MTASHFLVYRDVQNYWRWTLYAHNNRKIANSGEGYVNRADCIHGIHLVAGSNGLPIRNAA
ncbi:MAG: DUF1508 domain-containing protein [Caulobacter sp.]|nr:DUF1508 domain-containing protein [Caulobacter sp.]